MRYSVPPPLPRNAREGTVAQTVRALPRGARPSEVWRSAAFAILRLNPSECELLGTVFEDEGIADERRVLVLDLLAGAGTFEAQVVMRRLLALAVARRDSRMFATFVQRLGFVDHPDGPTLRFLMSVVGESRGEAPDVRAACAYALGAAAGQAWRAGDHDAAIRASDVLRRDLLQAGTSREKAALVTALGNAGIPNDAPTIMRCVNDADASVRAAAALALRKIDTAEARAQLLEMLADPEEKVAHGALVALAEHRLDARGLERLAELVLAGRTALALDGRILRVIVAQGGQLQPTGSRPGAIENALRLLLGRVEAAGANPIPGSGEHRLVSGKHRVLLTQGASGSSAPPPAPVAPSGSYRIVRQGETLEEVRARVAELGLDANAPATRAGTGTLAISPLATIGRRR